MKKEGKFWGEDASSFQTNSSGFLKHQPQHRAVFSLCAARRPFQSHKGTHFTTQKLKNMSPSQLTGSKTHGIST